MKGKMNAAVQALNHERHSGCLDCGKTIRNPICQSCISKEFTSWISNYPSLRRKVLGKVKRYVKTEERLAEDSQECVVCNRINVGVCPYCFTGYLLNLLIDAGAEKEVLQEYFELFNFDLGDFNGHWGYFREGVLIELT